jgi:predicted RNA-binding Zn-ribbon protein involved in translation (DUF1610 family)
MSKGKSKRSKNSAKIAKTLDLDFLTTKCPECGEEDSLDFCLDAYTFYEVVDGKKLRKTEKRLSTTTRLLCNSCGMDCDESAKISEIKSKYESAEVMEELDE